MTTQIRLDHDTRQQQIVAAARELIAGGGSDAMTIRAIASKVGVTEAAIYRHVKSKEEVLLLLIADVRQSLFEAISDAIACNRVALEKLERLLRLHVSYVELRQGISFVVIAEASQFQEPRVRSAGRRLVEDYLSLVEGIIAEGAKRGEIDSTVKPKVAAMIFFGMIQATVTRWLFDPASHPLTENAAELWELFRTSLEFSDESGALHGSESSSDAAG